MAEPLPLIMLLARNLVEVIDVPGVLASNEGETLFYNEAAGNAIGKRFEEFGRQSIEAWHATRLSDDGEPIEDTELPLTIALQNARPSDGRFRIVHDDGHEVEVDVNVVPLVDEEGMRGAMILFWPMHTDGT